MLDFIRKRKQSWLIKLLLAAIVIVFVLWGVGSYMAQPRQESVAEVNGDVISLREFQIHYERLIEYYRDLFKGNLTPEAIKALNLRRALLDELIERHLLLQEARRLGFEVTDEELMGSLVGVPDFQVGGRFSKERYQQFLRSKRLGAAEFEAEQRNQLAIRKLYDLAQGAVHVTEAEVRDRYRVEQERINLSFIRLSTESFIPEVKITAEEIKEGYERNKESLREPPKVQVEYLAYPYLHFSSKVQLSKEEIEAFYQRHRESRFHQPMAIRVRHILFRVPAGAGAQQKEEVRLRAEGVLREARSGGDFPRLAKEHSGDPSSAQGGDVGWLVKGQIMPDLEQTAFALKRGEISGVLESPSGYHILKVEETKQAKSRSLEESAEEIGDALRVEKGKAEAAKAIDSDREKILSGANLSQLAKERGLPLSVSPLFSPGETLPEVGPVEEFYKAAFSLSANEVSKALEGPTAYYLVRVKERKESSIPVFESVRPRLEKNLKEAKALESATQKAKTLLAELRKEKGIEILAQRHALKVEETGWFSRGASQIPKIGVLQEAKGGSIPISAHQPLPDRVYTQKEGVYLLVFKESREADMELFEKEKARLQEQALGEKRQKVLQRLLEGLKSRARIVPNAQFIEES
jgi:peptidyl-prolyl cis-trans isomerase D